MCARESGAKRHDAYTLQPINTLFVVKPMKGCAGYSCWTLV